MSKRNLSEREKNIAIVLVIVGFLALAYQLGYVPFKERSETVKTKILSARKKIQKNLRTVQKAKTYEEKYKSLLENFQQKGSDEQAMSATITEIESVAGQAQIRIADMKPQRVRKAGAYNNFSVSLTLDGQLTAIMDFLYSLQNQPHLFSVDELRLDKKSPNSTELKGYCVLSRSLLQP